MVILELSEKEKQNLTDEELEIAKARKLELLILPYLKRNIKFFYGAANIPKKYDAYNTQKNTKVLEETLKNKKSSMPVVCKQLCEMVVEILKENGLNAETVSCDTDMFRHVDVLLNTTSGKQYIINYLEEIENIQSGMNTPDFASQDYYDRRYKKFENKTTTDGKSLSNISFISQERLAQIDENLGYKRHGLYMNDVIEQIRREFKDFRTITAENEYLTEVSKMEKAGQKITQNDMKRLRDSIEQKYQDMSDDKILELKLDWIFNYFNQRMDITGHTDFVMYYSRLLLKQVLNDKEYKKLTRYDCFIDKKSIPENSQIKDVLDYENDEDGNRMRFCLVETGDKVYAFSTKPNVYKKIDKNGLENLSRYANITEVKRISGLVNKLAMRGNALPLVFHPLGQELLNERASLIEKDLSGEELHLQEEKLAETIKTTDGELTSITIPYPDGTEKYVYINENREFAVKTKNETTIYHYNEELNSFSKEIVDEGR